MAWRDDLRQASFRGVRFSVETAGVTIGRRLARHEYPQRDDPYLEDMGRKAREYRVEAFVIGPDYMSTRDALMEALETAGAGQLVHPYHGTLQVVVAGECQVQESTQHGGMARITIVFVEAGRQQEPKASVDTAAALQSQWSDLEEISASDFAQNFSVDGLPDYVSADALSCIQTALGYSAFALGNLPLIRANPLSSLRALLPENLLASLSAPLSIATAILSLARNAADITGLFSFGLPQVATAVTTPGRIAQNANRAAVASLVQQAATARRIIDLTASTPATVDDMRAARLEILTRSDAVLLSPYTGQAAADAMVQLRSDAVAHFMAVMPSLPRVTTLQPQAVRPAVVLAHDFYGDSWQADGRDDDLIARNKVRHPGFVPAGRSLSLVN